MNSGRLLVCAILVVAAASCSSSPTHDVVLEKIVIADHALEYPAIELTCDKNKDANRTVIVAVGNPVYNYLIALKELQLGTTSSVGQRYYLVESRADSPNCNANFPATTGIGGKSQQSTQTILLRIDAVFYLLDMPLGHRARLSRLGPPGVDGAPTHIYTGKMPISVNSVSYGDAVVRVHVRVL